MTHHHSMADNQASNMMGIAVLAAAIGAATALLFAPKRGSEMRQDLKGRYKDMRTKTQGTIEDAQDKMTEGVEAASAKVKDVADKAKDSADMAAEKARKAKDAYKSDLTIEEADMPSGRRPRL